MQNQNILKAQNPRVNIKNITISTILLSVLLVIGALVYTPYVLLMGLVAIISGVTVEYVFVKVRKQPYTFNAEP